MTCSEQCRSFVGLPIATIATLFMMFAALPAPAQTFTVLHNFEGSDGWQPFAGLTIDPAGNLYGTTQYGGILNCDGGGPAGCGVAYKLKKLDSSWVLSVLNEFQGREDFLPTDPGTITLGPGGVPYGVQAFGGTNEAGLLFQLQPPVTAPRTANAPWSYAVDWAYDSGNDGGQPSQVTFDPAGNIWGAEGDGGPPGAEGIVYELTPSASGWNQTIIYSFLDPDGYEPAGPVDVSLDPSGNIYSVTRAGGNQQCGGGGCGTVYELTHTSFTDLVKLSRTGLLDNLAEPRTIAPISGTLNPTKRNSAHPLPTPSRTWRRPADLWRRPARRGRTRQCGRRVFRYFGLAAQNPDP
jgi:hypothetical protein